MKEHSCFTAEWCSPFRHIVHICEHYFFVHVHSKSCRERRNTETWIIQLLHMLQNVTCEAMKHGSNAKSTIFVGSQSIQQVPNRTHTLSYLWFFYEEVGHEWLHSKLTINYGSVQFCDFAICRWGWRRKRVIFCKSFLTRRKWFEENKPPSTSDLPAYWKIAKIVLIHKSEDTNVPSNHRPIFLTSTSCKTLEHIVLKNLTTYFEENILVDVPHSLQKAYRQSLSLQRWFIISHSVLTTIIKQTHFY